MSFDLPTLLVLATAISGLIWLLDAVLFAPKRKARAGAEGKLFGSVTTTDIAEAVEAQTGIALDRRHVHLDEPIRHTGEHTATARLHAEVEFPITVDVTAK